MHFCWLPPDSSAMRERASRHADVEPADQRADRRSRSPRPLRTAPPQSSGSREMVTLKATLCGRKQPSVLRSSGSSPIPCRIAARGLRSAGRAAAQPIGRSARRVGADDGAQQLRAPRPGQAADAEDLALADVEVDAVQHARPDEAARPQRDFARTAVAAADRCRRAARPTIMRISVVGVDLADRPRADDGAVAQHRHAVADGEHLAAAGARCR